MIEGIGIDIVEIARVEEAVKKYRDKFLARVYSKQELEYCVNYKSYRFPEMAARFAAKEAYSKAIGTGLAGIVLNQVEVVHDKKGKPQLVVQGKLKKNVYVSLSHSKMYAIASVIVENGNKKKQH